MMKTLSDIVRRCNTTIRDTHTALGILERAAHVQVPIHIHSHTDTWTVEIVWPNENTAVLWDDTPYERSFYGYHGTSADGAVVESPASMLFGPVWICVVLPVGTRLPDDYQNEEGSLVSSRDRL